MDIKDWDILDSLPMPIVALVDDGAVLYLNRRMSETLGVCAKEWNGRSTADFAALIAERLGDSGFSSRLISRRDAGDSAPVEVEWRIAGNASEMREDSVILHEPDASVCGRALIYTDIGRQKAADRMRTEFIAVAAHELRAPMTAIKGAIDLVLDGAVGPVSQDGEELLQIAQKGCERLIRLINNVLDLSKIETGRTKLRLAQMDVRDAAERCISTLRYLAADNGPVLRLDCPARLPLIQADRDRIEQVITNLLSNAIKYSPPRSEVVVELRAGESWVQCSVADHGEGIPESELDAVFNKFHQVTGERRVGGTGLGLTIARALVQEHKGRIWAESKLQEGSRFIFRLPVLAA